MSSDLNSGAVVILSGGMDSTTALYWTIAELDEDPLVLSFDYGQRHRKELGYARAICRGEVLTHYVVDLLSVQNLLTGSALSDEFVEVPEGHYADDTMKLTVVPNRNAMMLNIAIAAAVARGSKYVVAGMHAGDHPVYPDCRPQFINGLSGLARIANEGFIHPEFEVMAPFINYTKRDIATIGDEYGFGWENTWSCYKGGEIHCGRCSTCVERLEALNGFEDKTEYADTEFWKTVVNAAQ